MRPDYHQIVSHSMATLTRLLRMRLRVTGQANLQAQPTIFVPNHFTRLETMLLPWLLYTLRGRVPHTLGMHGLFEGPGARFLQSVGVMSVKHPQRNRTIIRELMTDAHDWIIFAEGGLIKNKKTVENGRLHLTHPSHSGPPHTGAAMLALKAEISRQRYLQACAAEDMLRRTFYEREYDVQDPEALAKKSVLVQPLSITFHPMRASETIVSRLLARLCRNVNGKLLEEIAFESSLVLKRAEINLHFGRPVSVDAYLDLPRNVARRMLSRFAEHRHADVLLRRQARRLTRDAMRRVYTGIEVNIDHLVAVALRSLDRDAVDRRELAGMLLVAARSLAADDTVRVHTHLRDDVSRVLIPGNHEPFERALRLAVDQGIVTVDGSTLRIDRDRLHAEVAFDSIRMTNTMQVIANEVEPNRRVSRAMSTALRMTPADLRQAVAEALHDEHVTGFRGDYERWYDPEASMPSDRGLPLRLEPSRTGTGVLLIHGYLATPQQMRPLAEFLHQRGHAVYAVRLPSHGTSPDHLSQTTWRDWLDAARHGYALLHQSCDRVVVGGLSLGGVLAMLLAAEHSIDPAGVFAINPPMRLRDRRAMLVPTLLGWRRTLTRVGLQRAPGRLLNSHTETPELSYGRHPLESVHAVRQAAAECRRRIGRVTAPLLLMQSENDPIVVPDATRDAMHKAGSDLRLLTVLPFDRHNIVSGEGNELAFQSLNRFLIRLHGEVAPDRRFERTDVGRWRRSLARAGFIRSLP